MKRNKIVGIYLAAGLSTRMGSDKLRLPLGTMPLGNYALRAALSSDLDHVVIVSWDGEADWMDSSLYAEPKSRKWSVVPCSDAHLGQASSLRCGVMAAQEMKAEAIMILLADQPLITPSMINKLLLAYQSHPNSSFAASRYEGLARPPVLFSKEKFPDLLTLQKDQGARQLIRNDPSGICLDFTSPHLFMDVDTPDDYRNLLELWKS